MTAARHASYFQSLWASGYWIASSRNITDEVWAEDMRTKRRRCVRPDARVSSDRKRGLGRCFHEQVVDDALVLIGAVAEELDDGFKVT